MSAKLAELFCSGLPFSALTSSERLFIDGLRRSFNTVRVKRDASNRASGNVTGARRRQRFSAPQDMPPHVSLFIESLAGLLNEPLMLAPRRCRCPLVFHERLFIDLMRARTGADLRAFRSQLKDILSEDEIECVWRFAGPSSQELTAWEALVAYPPAAGAAPDRMR